MAQKNTLFTLLFLFIFVASGKSQSLFDDLSDKIDIVVAQDGTGDYATVMEAINAAPSNSTETVVIFIKNGSYYEKIIIPNDKPNLTIIGEDVDKTVLWYDDRSLNQVDLNTFTSHSVRVDANDIKIMNLTIENPADQSQAVALHGNGDRQTFAHCRILGWQDTYYSDMRSRNYFKDCFIQGRTDYIFGFGVVLMDSCQIHTVGSGGIVTAASTPEDYQFGMVIRNSVFAEPITAGTFSLGRPWFDYARTVIMNSFESENLLSRGWSNWGGRENTCYYAEYKCFGPGSAASERASFGLQLTDTEAEEYTIENIFSAGNFNNLEDVGTAEEYLTGLGYDYDELLAKSPGLAELGSEDADILKYFYRWVGHASEPYLDSIVWRADGEFPEKPTTDWIPEINSDEIYLIMRKHFNMFLDSTNTRMGDFDLVVNGEIVQEFDTSQVIYGIELPAGSTEPAEIGVEGDAFAFITYPDEVPGITELTVTPYNRIGGETYQVYNSIDSAFWDAELASLTVDDNEILQEGVYEYTYELSAGANRVPRIRFTRKYTPDQKVLAIEQTDVIPGTSLVTIAAPNGTTIIDYKVNFTFPLAIDEAESNGVIVTNPAKGAIEIRFKNPISSETVLTLYSLAGKKLKQSKMISREIIDNGYSWETHDLAPGLYLLKIANKDLNIGRRIIIE